jgi:hypothetical protein
VDWLPWIVTVALVVEARPPHEMVFARPALRPRATSPSFSTMGFEEPAV